MSQNLSLNDTLEEALRLELCESQKTINKLMSELELRKRLVAEEVEAKYKAYIKINELQQEIQQLKDKFDVHD